jgi:hypothetical protein
VRKYKWVDMKAKMIWMRSFTQAGCRHQPVT